MSFRPTPAACAVVLIGLLVVPGRVPADPTGADTSAVRRTTIATADVEASLRFYRDLLGFTIEYDETITDPAVLGLFAPGSRWARAIALRQGPDLAGSIGLFHAPEVTAAGDCRPVPGAGAVGLLLLTADPERLADRLRAAGVPLLSGRVFYAGAGTRIEAFTALDPNCIRVTFARIRAATADGPADDATGP